MYRRRLAERPIVRKLRAPRRSPGVRWSAAGVVRQLREAHRTHIGTLAQRLVPLNESLEPPLETPPWAPAELAFGCTRVDREVAGLGRVDALVVLPRERSVPHLAEPFDHPAHLARFRA